MERKEQEYIALMRHRIIHDIITGNYDSSWTKNKAIIEATKQVYKSFDNSEFTVSRSTISRWIKAYETNGFDGLIPQKRSDCGHSRRLDGDIIETIKHYKTTYPRLPATVIYGKLIEKGVIKKTDVSLSTVNRCVNQIKSDLRLSNKKDMRRYEVPHVNMIWAGDSSVGPYISIDGKKHKTYMIALIDDASRMIVHLDLYLNDNSVNLMDTMKSAVTKYGVPEMFRFDNGPNYRNHQIKLIAARINSTISYCKPYTPEGKSKIERVFRTIKDQFFAQINIKDYTNNLSGLQQDLGKFINDYNNRIHSSLKGLTPSQRFFQESNLIKRLNDEIISNTFLFEVERTVSADSVIKIDNREYEIDYIYSGERHVFRYTPNMEKVYIVEERTGKLEPIHLLDKNANSKAKRIQPKLCGGEE